MKGSGVALAACMLVACGGGDGAGDLDAALVDGALPTDAPATDVRYDAVVAAPDVVTADAPRDVPRDLTTEIAADVVGDVALDAARDAAFDAASDVPRDAASDAARDAVTDVAADAMEPVPLPAAVPPGDVCHALLRRIGVRFTVSSATRGVVDPVTVTTPINGVSFHGTSFSSAERPMLMDCRLAVALWHLTDALRSRWNVTDVMHLGVYNYRVIAGSTTLSQHAYATAIDLAAFRDRGGAEYSVLTDFTMNGQPTCPPRATSARDRLLKEVACWMYESRTFHIVLTPNYNAAHRDHFHVDLTTGSHTIRYELPGGVDPEHSPLFDWLYDDD